MFSSAVISDRWRVFSLSSHVCCVAAFVKLRNWDKEGRNSMKISYSKPTNKLKRYKNQEGAHISEPILVLIVCRYLENLVCFQKLRMEINYIWKEQSWSLREILYGFGDVYFCPFWGYCFFMFFIYFYFFFRLIVK